MCDNYYEIRRMMEIAELRSNGIQDLHLMDWRFSAAEDSRHIQMGKRYVNNWETAKENNLGLLFWGGVGSGKSFLAACIANALLDQGIPVLMTNFSKVLNRMGNLYSEERYAYIESFRKYELLIIDDLGIERNTDYALEQVYAVIDERYKANLPLIVTTNLTISQLRNPIDAAHARIYSRILEMCTPVRIDCEDRRKAIASSKQERTRKLLFPEVIASGK